MNDDPGSMREWLVERIAKKQQTVDILHHSSYEFAFAKGEMSGWRTALAELNLHKVAPTITLELRES